MNEITTAILIAGGSSVVFRLLGALLASKKSELLSLLQEHMPMMIMLALTVMLFRGADYGAPRFGLDYLCAGTIAIFMRKISGSGVAAIVVSTAVFVMLDYFWR